MGRHTKYALRFFCFLILGTTGCQHMRSVKPDSQRNPAGSLSNIARNLFNEFQKIPELEPVNRSPNGKTVVESPIFQNSSSKVMILVGDIHDFFDEPEHSWKIEYKQVQLLKDQFGIRCFGLENWPGFEEERDERDRRGELKQIISQPDFRDLIVGLESLETTLIGYKGAVSTLYDLNKMKANLSISDFEDAREFINLLNRHFTIQEVIAVTSEFQEFLKLKGLSTWEKFNFDYRNKVAFRKMSEAMEERQQNVCAMVIGWGHLPGLAQLFREAGYSIIAVK